MNREITRYSATKEGNTTNHNREVTFDYTDGYVGISAKDSQESPGDRRMVALEMTTSQLVRVIFRLWVIAAVSLLVALFSLYMAWATR